MVGRLSVDHYFHNQRLVEPGFPAGTFISSLAEKLKLSSLDIHAIVCRKMELSSRNIHIIAGRKSQAFQPGHSYHRWQKKSSFPAGTFISSLAEKVKFSSLDIQFTDVDSRIRLIYSYY